MYILRDPQRSEDFEKIKIFWFLMLFCNQNDLNVKIWIFAKSAHQNVKLCRNEKTSSYRERFFSGRGQVVYFWFPIIFGRYSADKSKIGRICWCMHRKKIFKIDFFRFLKKWLKCLLNVIYMLENIFKHLWGHFPAIFHHIIMFEAIFKNHDFLKKMDFLRFLRFFGRGSFGCKNAPKLSKNFKNFKNVFYRSLRYS